MFTNKRKYGKIKWYIIFLYEVVMQIIKFNVGDVLELKKPHPCGNKLFRVMRVGSEMRVVCLKCSRDMNIDRLKLEKSTKKVMTVDNTEDKS